MLLLLIASIGIVWLVGRPSSNAPALGAQPPSTPTPRSLAFLRETPAPSAPGETRPGEDSVVPTPTPGLLTMPTGEQLGAPSNGIVFSAPGEDPFAAIASGSWDATEDALRNDGATAEAEPWLKLATISGAAFAIEAEIRVNGRLDTFCHQSFGLAGGDPVTGQMYGAGILFPCADESARAQLTDVSVWQDGYHADPVIAESDFDPAAGWHTYRFELRGTAIRLIVDGVGIATGAIDPALTAGNGAEAGVWSQGVDLEIREVEVTTLPPR